MELVAKFFAIMNPLGCMAQFVSLLSGYSVARQRRIIVRELAIALGILLGICLFGDQILGYLSIELPALQIGGGCILFLIAYSMLFPPALSNKNQQADIEKRPEPFVVPLAIPLVAGPGIITTILVAAKNQPVSTVSGAIILVWLLSAIVLLLAPQIGGLLGKKGLVVLDRFVGLILILISVNMVLAGLKNHFIH